jgi:WD40 repeat protein
MRVLQHELVPRCLAYAADGSLLAVGDEGAVTLYSLPTAGSSGQLRLGDSQSVEAIAFSPGGDYLAAGGVRDMAVWKLQGRRLFGKVPTHPNGTRALVFSPDGQEIVSTGWDKTVRWWTRNLSEARPTLTVAEPLTSLAFNRAGDELAGGSQRALVFWSWDDRRKKWQPRQSLEVSQPIFALSATPDGKLLATGHANGSITLVDFAKRQPLVELAGHDWVIYGLAFTPDGARLVSGGADGTVKLWDVPHRRLIETYRFHKSWVTCVAVSPDGMTAAAGSDDYTVVLWDLADV